MAKWKKKREQQGEPGPQLAVNRPPNGKASRARDKRSGKQLLAWATSPRPRRCRPSPARGGIVREIHLPPVSTLACRGQGPPPLSVRNRHRAEPEQHFQPCSAGFCAPYGR